MQLQPELDPEGQYMENNYTWPFRTGRNPDKPRKPLPALFPLLLDSPPEISTRNVGRALK